MEYVLMRCPQCRWIFVLNIKRRSPSARKCADCQCLCVEIGFFVPFPDWMQEREEERAKVTETPITGDQRPNIPA
jgi:hypothetical protein